jgi:P-type E1-E2 ATPase
VPIADIVVGQHVRVRPGEKVPLDGKVIDGRSAADESIVTGESMPVTMAIGAAVMGGTLKGGDERRVVGLQ